MARLSWRLLRRSGRAASVGAADAVTVLLVTGLLEIRTLARYAPAENGLPDKEAVLSRILMISEVCHNFPATADGFRPMRKRRAAHALAWRYSCSGADAQQWIRESLRDRGQEYERALDAALKTDGQDSRSSGSVAVDGGEGSGAEFGSSRL